MRSFLQRSLRDSRTALGSKSRKKARFFSNNPTSSTEHEQPYDAVLIGGGVMSSTLAVFLKTLEPSWRIRIVEILPQPGEESSNGWNNAGTGHSALCELNYTPETDGKIDISNALKINEQFQVSRQFWSWLYSKGLIPPALEPVQIENVCVENQVGENPHLVFNPN